MKNITLLAVLLLLGSMQIISAQNNNFFNGLKPRQIPHINPAIIEAIFFFCNVLVLGML
jgi:hypothetical protein